MKVTWSATHQRASELLLSDNEEGKERVLLAGGLCTHLSVRKDFYGDWLWEGEKPLLVRGVTWADSGRRKGPEWQGYQFGAKECVCVCWGQGR